MKKFLTELLDDVITEYWLQAVVVGVLAVLGSVAGLIWASTMEAPEFVSIFGQQVSCESVREGSQTVGGQLAGAFSQQAQAAQDQCSEAGLKNFLQLAGTILLPLAILWSAGWGYAAHKYDISASA